MFIINQSPLLLKLLISIFSATSILCAQQPKELSLTNNNIRIVWQQSNEGWKIKTLAVRKGESWVNAENPSGEYTFLYASEKPVSKPSQTFKTITGVQFPEPAYHKQIQSKWDESTGDVSLNTAGKAYHFLPAKAVRSSLNSILFTQQTEVGTLISEWGIDPGFSTDVLIKQTLSVKKPGYYSIASATLASVSEKDLQWATVPGYFQGNKIEKNFVAAYAYGNGVPELPVVYRERCASTLCPMITSNNGITYAVIPNPDLGRDP